MSKFVTAVVIATGVKQRIPAHWLGHPVLGKPFRVAPSARHSEDPTPVVADQDPPVSTDATPTDATTGDPDTPAAGGEQEN